MIDKKERTNFATSPKYTLRYDQNGISLWSFHEQQIPRR